MKISALDTLRVANRSPTPASNINDFLVLSDDIWGGPGPPFPADLGGSGGPGRNLKYVFLSFQKLATTCLRIGLPS